jgi:hypothetical protein
MVASPACKSLRHPGDGGGHESVDSEHAVGGPLVPLSRVEDDGRCLALLLGKGEYGDLRRHV